ncbi:hypothetical protein TARUN_4781 [Trichoderma arundinaceum]|uniref:Uncharacterized protein n=1 Tax=Trichoderma arundinaceum TaxID=490622 RepID=A0A395NNA4_TRIAR|nr:hypothetical protein TARUN_4781 [Trichoderma arundinaceum]
MLEIAKTVSNSPVTPITSLDGPPDVTAQRDGCHSVPESTFMEPSSSLPSNRRSCSADLDAIGADHSHNFSRQRTANSIRSSHQSQERAVENDVSLPKRPREHGDLQSRLEYKPPSPQCEQLMKELNYFAFRLIEITLSRAYSMLFAMLSSDDVCRAFGSALRMRSREQILVDLRWLLGPGKKALPQASGYLWEGVSREAPSRWMGCSPLDDVCLELDSDEASEIYCQPAVCQSKHLTALGVVQELLNLKARVIDEDTLEITLGDQQSSNPGNSSRTKSSAGEGISDPTFSSPNNDNTHDSSTEPLKLGLSIPLLTVNLAVIAVCAKAGPIYSSSEMAKAVEASIVMINRNEEVAAG